MSRVSARRHGGSAPCDIASRAARTARSTSAGPHLGTRPSSRPSYGAMTAIVSSVVTRSPAIGSFSMLMLFELMVSDSSKASRTAGP